MVVGETHSEAGPSSQQSTGPPANIDNIMSGISNTGAVKMNNHRKKLRQRFDIIKKLGQGTYGKVQLGINKETGQEVAIKTIKKCKIETDADLIRIRREVQIMSSVQHPNIIHIYEVFENREKMVLVMEFAAGGELYDYLSERKVLSEDEARRVFRQISTAVYYCHKHKICHRDLKLENILLDENGNAKIADFGLSNVFDEQRLLATFCGSPLYASPEIVKGTPYQGPEVDCWSLGVLLYTLVYGAMPFDGSNFKRLVKQISQGDYFEPKKPSRASPLIREMLTVCPKRRANIEQICNHWWVNEGYQESCLDLAEELANQTPVRLDVLLSLSPPSITADQLVVTGPEESKSTDRVPRSHSVGSIIDLGGNTEAERRILDMVAAGGEAALMPSPTRTLTPAESPAQTKRKLESTVSTENAVGIIKKKEKPTESLSSSNIKITKSDIMEAEPEIITEDIKPPLDEESKSNVEKVYDIPENISNTSLRAEDIGESSQIKQKNCKKVEKIEGADVSEAKDTTKVKQKLGTVKVVKKIASKSKAELPKVDEVKTENVQNIDENVENQNTETITSLPEENVSKPSIRQKSRIFETAEKFQNINNHISDKTKKNSMSGVNVGISKKDFERRSSVPLTATLQIEKTKSESQDEDTTSRKNSLDNIEANTLQAGQNAKNIEIPKYEELKESDSKSSLRNFSLEDARRSMENSIALLNKAKTESSKEVDQLGVKTEGVDVPGNLEREKKLKSAREIIGNAIQPGRLCMGVRKPPVPFGLNGRSISGSVVPLTNTSNSGDRKLKVQLGPELSDIRTATFSVSSPEQKTFNQEPLAGGSKPIAIGTLIENIDPDHLTKTSRAEITLKSATLPRRKPAKTEIQLDIQTKQEPTSMRFSTEMKHPVADLRSAPIREHPVPYSPINVHQRATSLEPQAKELIIPVQRPPTYQRTGSNSFRAGSLSRQSTNDSDTDTTITLSQSNVSSGGISQPIKKSPREFIIPISVEGGGYITPRAGSLEPSESNASSTFNRIGRNRRMGSLLNEKDSEDDLLFQRLHRHTSIGRDSDSEEPKFTMHRLRSTRPSKKGSQDANDSASSGEEDDEDGFEILTAENLFSTLLQRVRALTQRLNVSNDTSSAFPSSRFINSLRQSTAHNPFWHHDPFGSPHYSYSYRTETIETKETRLNNGSSAWRHSMTRDLNSDFDSMFSRSGATPPRGTKFKTNSNEQPQPATTSLTEQPHKNPQKLSANNPLITDDGEILDLRDLDLSQLRLTKKDLETLSSLTPGLSKRLQDQLLAQLPPTQAKKLSRTLSMQNYSSQPIKIYKRSLSGGRDINEAICDQSDQQLIENLSDKLTTNITTSSLSSTTKTSKDDNIVDKISFYRRSVSKPRYDDTNSVSRSSSRCRDALDSEECNSHSLRSSYSSDINDRFRSHTPQMDDYANPYDRNMKYYQYEKSISPSKYNSLPPRNKCLSPSKDTIGRPPSGCLSPPPLPPDSSLRRRTSQRRISRFLRPDFFDTPREESVYVKDKMDRDSESQRILREIRERSQDRQEKREISLDNLSIYDVTKKQTPEISNNITDMLNVNYNNSNKNQSVINNEKPLIINESDNNKNKVDNNKSIIDNNNNNNDAENNSVGKKSFADKILEELQCISLYETKVKTSTENKQIPAVITEKPVNNGNVIAPNEQQPSPPATIIINKDGKKVKIIKRIKKKLVSSDNENQSKDDSNKSKSVDTKDNSDCIIKTSNNNNSKEIINDIKMVTNLTNEIDSVILLNTNDKQSSTSQVKLKKESKLIRPKSYPSKEPEKILNILPNKNEMQLEKQDLTKVSHIALDEPKQIEEYKHIRPQSYPAVHIIVPNDIKNKKDAIQNEKIGKIVDNSVISHTMQNAENKVISVSKENDSLSLSSIEPIKSVKKITKIVKKVTPSKYDNKDGIKEKVNKKSPENSNTIINTIKEKSPEKKANKGFLYTIGQKFEKLRESSKEKIKEKKAIKEEIMQEKDKEKIDINYITGKKIESLVNNEDHNIVPILQNIKVKKPKLIEPNTMASNQNISENTIGDEDHTIIKIDKKSRIDTMIRNLRDRSVPRGPSITESGLIKRAVSVEDLSGSFNKRGVNKVLGLFKKYEKENSNEVVDCKASPNISNTINNDKNNTIHNDNNNTINNDNNNTINNDYNNNNNNNNNSNLKERPKSSGFVSKIRKGYPYTGAKSDTILTLTEEMHKKCVIDDINNVYYSENTTKIPIIYNCPECNDVQDSVTKRHSTSEVKLSNEERERIRNNRKGLMLDFSKLDSTDNNNKSNENNALLKTNNSNNQNIKQQQVQKHSNINSQVANYHLLNVSNDNSNNHNTNYYDKLNNDSNNNINDNNNNNYIYLPSLPNEMNQNHVISEPFENNMISPDSRSPFDDGASTSTFFSPSTEEPELYFDNWSNCSDDRFTITPSPSQSRLSRNSHLDSPANENSTESIVDRIRRKSFYTRFNEKKPKRVSNIVGPAAKEYYRDTATRSKSKPPEYTRSFTSTLPEPKVRNIHEYYRPIKSSIDNYYSTKTSSNNKLRHEHDDFHKTKLSLSDYQSPLINSHRVSGIGSDYKYNSDIGNSYKKHDDILARKNSVYDPTLSIYGTYNPKRHIPTTSTASYSNSSTTSNLDNYGTLGRKIKPYEQRSVSLLDSSSSTFNRVLGTLRREPRASIELGGVARSNLRVRNQSTSRSPSNL